MRKFYRVAPSTLMNQKWLEIYKKYRARKYDRDLDKLRNDLDDRGLALSGARENQERWLKEDYEDEVAMKNEEAVIHKEESRERQTSIWTNRILAFVAIVSFFVTLVVSWKTIQNSNEANLIVKKQQLPAFSAERIGASLITSTSTERLLFVNRGGECHNLTPHTISFLEIGIKKEGFQEIYLLPIEAYFTWIYTEKCEQVEFSSTNEIIASNFYNQGEVQKTINGYYHKVLPQGWETYMILRHYVELTYQDVYGEFRSEHYSFSPIHSGVIIAPQEWQRLSDLHEKKDKIRAGESGDRVLEYLEEHGYDHKLSGDNLRIFMNVPIQTN